jgi:CheY-like chemotaxis protein
MEVERPILVVEDNEPSRLVVKTLLESAGYRVACATNGREAMDHLRQAGPPRLILLDLSMPVMDGWQFCQQQKRNPAWASIPVVLLSGEDDLARHAAALGVAGYFPKPIEFERLLETIPSLGAQRAPRCPPCARANRPPKKGPVSV